ncbi:hypothetical protein Landi51_07946 [Colletotrichum acutatum]
MERVCQSRPGDASPTYGPNALLPPLEPDCNIKRRYDGRTWLRRRRPILREWTQDYHEEMFRTTRSTLKLNSKGKTGLVSAADLSSTSSKSMPLSPKLEEGRGRRGLKAHDSDPNTAPSNQATRRVRG